MIFRISFILLLLSVLHSFGTYDPIEETEKTKAELLQKALVWLESAKSGEQAYVVFRKELNIGASTSNAELRIFADTRYMLWINGKYVERGPCRFDPKHPEYDILQVGKYLIKGKNAIAILVHHYAIGNFNIWHDRNARMMNHSPGLTACLTTYNNRKTNTFITDISWKASSHTRFLPSPGCYSSVPDNIDARLDQGDWTLPSFNDSKWEQVSTINGDDWGKLSPRTIPLLREVEITPKEICQETLNGKTRTQSQSLLNTFPLKMSTGHQLVIDVGKVVQAYPILDFNAVENSKIEIGYATLFHQNGNKPLQISFIEDMNSRYVAKNGFQSYMGGDTYGFRYLIVKVDSGEITLKGVKVVDRRYPFDRIGLFTCNDSLLNKLWNVCVNTVEVCSEDAYVDCADRERAQWMADGYKMNYPVSRSTLGVKKKDGEYQYSDSRLLKNMLRHVALSQLSDGRVQPMRPSDYKAEDRHGVIDDYSCLFVQALREYFDRTGDIVFLKEIWPQAINTIDYFMNRKMENGLVNATEFVYFDNPLVNVKCEGATINAFIYGSLRDMAYLSGKLNLPDKKSSYEKSANDLYANYNRLLWNGVAYYSALFDKDSIVPSDNPPSFSEPYKGEFVNGCFSLPTPHAALMALYYNLVPSSEKYQVLNYVLKCCDEKQVWWPYTSKFYLDLLYRENCADMDQRALDYIRNSFGHMIDYETFTTSEDWKGGSFVHESGSHPAYFMSAYVLGVRTEVSENGLQLIIQPRLGDLVYAEGTVLSEFGEVMVKWEKLKNGNLSFSFSIPKSTSAWIYLPVQQQVLPKELTVNDEKYIDQGSSLNKGRIEGRYYKINLKYGKYSGKITF